MGHYKVTGPLPIIGRDGAPVATGDVVDLDEEVTLVEPLIAAGCISRADDVAEADDAAVDEGDE